MNGYEKEVKELLRINGWVYDRQAKGSHEYWKNGDNHVTVSHSIKSRHTANAIMKEAGIRHKF
jgi:predicted RNA binding protein YcfA (HicA-like mRNA interferase family)